MNMGSESPGTVSSKTESVTPQATSVYTRGTGDERADRRRAQYRAPLSLLSPGSLPERTAMSCGKC